MENLIKQFTKSIQSIRLETDASDRIRNRLVEQMRLHPIQTKSPYQRFFTQSPLKTFMGKSVAVVLMTAGFGGATAFAATGSLPGDTLYPMKVGVIEPVQGLLATTSEKRAARSVSLALIRVKEVEQLASKNRLTSDRGVRVRESFDHSLAVAQVSIGRLKKENPAIATKLEESLDSAIDEHKAVLDAFAITSSSTSASEAESFATHLKNKVQRKAQGTRD
jgi:hypothetical protein